MMNKKYLLYSIGVVLILIGLLTIPLAVNAEDTITIIVGAKHIEGSGNTANQLFLISTLDGNGYYHVITSDYLVSPGDYYKINVGDTVTLKLKDNGYCELVNKDTDKGWF